MNTKYILHLSGGKDSTALLIYILENNLPLDEIIFCDTTKEFPDMYNHLDQIEKSLNVSITRLKEKSFDYWFYQHKKTKGKNKGEYGYGWPFMGLRWCTKQLKQWVANKYIKSLDVPNIQYLGIAYNEKQRAEKFIKLNYSFPLITGKISEDECLRKAYSYGFTWNGLYEKIPRVGCYLCPLRKLSGLEIIYNEFPELWEDIRFLDSKTSRPFKLGYTLQEIEKKFS